MREKTIPDVLGKHRRLDERTLRMIKEYPTLLDQGWSIKRIAKKFGLCTRTVHYRMDDICLYHKKTREEMMRKPTEPKELSEQAGKPRDCDELMGYKPIDLKKMKEEIDCLEKESEDCYEEKI